MSGHRWGIQWARTVRRTPATPLIGSSRWRGIHATRTPRDERTPCEGMSSTADRRFQGVGTDADRAGYQACVCARVSARLSKQKPSPTAKAYRPLAKDGQAFYRPAPPLWLTGHLSQAGLNQMSLRLRQQRDWFSVDGEFRLDDGEVARFAPALNLRSLGGDRLGALAKRMVFLGGCGLFPGDPVGGLRWPGRRWIVGWKSGGRYARVEWRKPAWDGGCFGLALSQRVFSSIRLLRGKSFSASKAARASA